MDKGFCGRLEGDMHNKILLYLVILAVIETVHGWLWWPWNHLVCVVKKLRGGKRERKENRE